MSGAPPDLREALAATPGERARLAPPPPAPAWCAEATAPEPGEVARLLARAPRPAPARRPVLAWALAAALAVLGAIHLLPWHGDPAPEAERLGPSIAAEGAADLAILRDDDAGMVVELRAGAAWFEVDPQGARHHLEVRAGDVTVEVTGTRFRVARDGARVEVEVARGSVAVHRPAGSFALHTGERWTSTGVSTPPSPPPSSPTPPLAPRKEPAPGPRVAAAPAPPAVPEPAIPVTATCAEAWAAALDPRGHDDARLARVDAFLARCDDPALGAEAGLLRLQFLPGLLPGEEAIAAADAWLAAHPGHPRAVEARFLRATVAREQLGDCGLALADYERVAAEASGNLAETAAAWAERCGDEAGGKDR